MSIIPDGEDLRRAIKWISDERKQNPEKKINSIIDEACGRYDLSPKDADFIYRKFGSSNEAKT